MLLRDATDDYSGFCPGEWAERPELKPPVRAYPVRCCATGRSSGAPAGQPRLCWVTSVVSGGTYFVVSGCVTSSCTSATRERSAATRDLSGTTHSSAGLLETRPVLIVFGGSRAEMDRRGGHESSHRSAAAVKKESSRAATPQVRKCELLFPECWKLALPRYLGGDVPGRLDGSLLAQVVNRGGRGTETESFSNPSVSDYPPASPSPS